MKQLLIKGLLLFAMLVIDFLLTVLALKRTDKLLGNGKIFRCCCVLAIYFSFLIFIYAVYAYASKMLFS